MRIQVPSARSAAVQTVSPSFRDSVGYVLTVIRTRSFAMVGIVLKVLRSECLAPATDQLIRDTVAVTLYWKTFKASQRNSVSLLDPISNHFQGWELFR